MSTLEEKRSLAKKRLAELRLKETKGESVPEMAESFLTESFGSGGRARSEAMVKGITHGLPFIGEWSDELKALTNTVIDHVKSGNEEKFLETYRRLREVERAESEKVADEQGWVYYPSMIITGLLSGGLLAKLGTKVASKAGKKVLTGFGAEFTAGVLGASEADLTKMDAETLKQAGKEATNIAKFGVGYGSVKLTSRAISKIASFSDFNANLGEKISNAYRKAKEGIVIHDTTKGELSSEIVRLKISSFNKEVKELLEERADLAKKAKDEMIAALDNEMPKGVPLVEIQDLFIERIGKLIDDPSHVAPIQKQKDKAGEALADIYNSLLFGPKDKSAALREISNIKKSTFKKVQNSKNIVSQILSFPGKLPKSEEIQELALSFQKGGYTEGEAQKVVVDFFKDKQFREIREVMNKYQKKVTVKDLDKLRGDIWELLNFNKSKFDLTKGEVELVSPTSGSVKGKESRKAFTDLNNAIKDKLSKFSEGVASLPESKKVQVDGELRFPTLNEYNDEISDSLQFSHLYEKHGIRDLAKIRTGSQSKSVDKAAVFLREVEEKIPEVGAKLRDEAKELAIESELLELVPGKGVHGMLSRPKVAAEQASGGMSVRMASAAGETVDFIQRSVPGALDNSEFFKGFLAHKIPYLYSEWVSSANAGDHETMAQIIGDVAPQIEEFMEPSPVKVKGVRIKTAIQSPRHPNSYKVTSPEEQNILLQDFMDDENLSHVDRFKKVQRMTKEQLIDYEESPQKVKDQLAPWERHMEEGEAEDKRIDREEFIPVNETMTPEAYDEILKRQRQWKREYKPPVKIIQPPKEKKIKSPPGVM